MILAQLCFDGPTLICIKHNGDDEPEDISTLFSNGSFTQGADKSLAWPTSRYILFGSENISFDASLVIYINSTNIPPIMIINRIYENQNLLSL